MENERLADSFSGRLSFNVPMSEFTSLGIGGPADVMAYPTDESDLKEIVLFAARKGFPIFVIGCGTNLLVRDGGIRGVVVNLTDGFNKVLFGDSGKVEAGSGVRLASLVRQCAGRGLSGMEFAIGIPGTVGGAVAMNAGAYGAEMGELVENIDVMGMDGKIGTIGREALNFTYRGCDLPAGRIILKVRLRLKEGSVAAINERMESFKEKRKGTQSIRFPNAGSVFKNPGVGESAGRLVEEAGLKGMKVGGAEVSKVHGNYIVNVGGAKASDIMSLMASMRDKVHKLRGIALEPEIKVIGED